jgi:hypothetical protein
MILPAADMDAICGRHAGMEAWVLEVASEAAPRE